MSKLVQAFPVLLAVLSGLLFLLAWPPAPFGFFQLGALTPLLFLADLPALKNDSRRFFLLCFLAFLIRNAGCLYWIACAHVAGALLIILVLSLVNTLPLLLYHVYRKKILSGPFSAFFLIFCWISMEAACEYVLQFPWMNLGLALAKNYQFIQWYEYTGPYGGSLWLVSLNVLLYYLFKVFRTPASRLKFAWLSSFTLLLIVPPLFSYIRYSTYSEYLSASNVVVVQPHDDVHTQKFSKKLSDKQTDDLIRLSTKSGTPETAFFIWPETALEPWHALDEDSLSENASVIKIRHFLERYRNGNVLTGLQTYKIGFRYRGDTSWFNAAISVENSDRLQIYHKQKLVPGTETNFLNLEATKKNAMYFFIGGLDKTFTKDGKSDLFFSQDGIGLAPVVCFESVFGSYVAKLVSKGAQFIIVMTNDDWWGNTAGTWQHESYARLLAIENRRSLARSSNSGVSCLINQKGDILAESLQGREDVLSADLNANEAFSFYTRNGDLILPISLFFLLACCLWYFFSFFTRKNFPYSV